MYLKMIMGLQGKKITFAKKLHFIFMNKYFIVFAFFTSLFFSNCTSLENIVYLENRPVNDDVIQYNKKSTENKLQPGDVIYVRILSMNKEINDIFNLDNTGARTNITSETSINLQGFTINPAGYIRLPIIDTVKVAGYTVFEVEDIIQNTVNSYFKNATVIVKLLNAKISVLGEVNRPGSFIVYRNELSIFEAIALAGDVNQYADKKRVLVIRTSGEKNETYRVDLTDEKIMSSETFYLLPDDIIIVEPLKLKSFRLNTPTISIVFSAISTLVLTLTFIYKK